MSLRYSGESASSAAKRKRVTRACDKCHRNGSKCSRNDDDERCVRCVELGIPCTFDRPVKRRGPPARRTRVDDGESPAPSVSDIKPSSLLRPRGSQGSMRDSRLADSTPTSREQMSVTSAGSTPLLEASASFWHYDDILDAATVQALADIFYTTAYPLRPFLHWPTWMSELRAERYRSNWGVFIVTMAMCALSAGKLADGGVQGAAPTLKARATTLASECYHAAVQAVRRDDDFDLGDGTDLVPLLKARAILSSTCLQAGNLNAALAHNGEYSILSALAGFHDEANWPSDLTEIQRQERRRLFWFAYQADHYTSTAFGLVPRHREARANVQYPAEVDDDDLCEEAPSPSQHVSFLRGFNVCTDLYRILEHVYDKLRADPGDEDESRPGQAVTAFLSRAHKVNTHETLQMVKRLLEGLPPELKRVAPMTGDPRADALGFTAMNIMITAQTLKMLLALSDGSSVHQRCAIASELLDELSTLPTVYLQASSLTTLQHVAHIGHLLSDIIDGPLPTWTYLQVRNILLVLSEFISKLEALRVSSPDLATKLREQIVRIDETMNQSAGNGGALPGLGQSLMRALPLSAPANHHSAMPNEATSKMEDTHRHEAETAAPPQQPPSFNHLHSQALPTEEANMISLDDALGQSQPSAGQPPAQPGVDEPMPPHDALSALQLNPPQPSSSFSPLGFAAQQGMFDFGMGMPPMDDALIGEFLRFWPAHGALGETVPEGMSAPHGM